MPIKYAITVKLVSKYLPLFFTPNSLDKRVNSPEKSASYQERSLSSPYMTMRSPHLAQRSQHLAQRSPHLSPRSPHLMPSSLHWPLNSPHLKVLATTVLAQSCMEQMPAQLVSEKVKQLPNCFSRVCRTSLAGFLLVQPREVCHA